MVKLSNVRQLWSSKRAKSPQGDEADDHVNAFEGIEDRQLDVKPRAGKKRWEEQQTIGESLDDVVLLNRELVTLQTVFPDVQAEALRELLRNFSEESRMYLVTNALLKDRQKYNRGILKVPSQRNSLDESRESAQSLRSNRLVAKDMFRSEQYKAAVTRALSKEFKGLGAFALNAVLAESNYAYAESREKLLNIADKSWRLPITNFFAMRRTPTRGQNPFVDSSKTVTGQSPKLRPTGCKELDDELYAIYLEPATKERLQSQLSSDEELARKLNEEEATEALATFDCDVCYGSYTFDDMIFCTEAEHSLCYSCVQRTANEAINGQGWAQSVDPARSTLKCVAPTSGQSCPGIIPQSLLERALSSTENDRATLRRLHEKVVSDNLATTTKDLGLKQCPFCTYAEATKRSLPSNNYSSSNSRSSSSLRDLFATYIAKLPPHSKSRTIPAFLILLYLAYTHPPFWDILCFFIFLTAFDLRSLFKSANRLAPHIFTLPLTGPGRQKGWQKSQGVKFICRNPRCGTTSCLSCKAVWHDIHTCHSSPKQSLRLHVEAAVTMAIKRTCPSCNLSFVKSSGCNKMVCNCGYAMCYLCRADVTKDKYQHYCPHFRPAGGPCDQCNKCELYRNEDEEAVVRVARKRAEDEWWESEGRALGEGVRRMWEGEGYDEAEVRFTGPVQR